MRHHRWPSCGLAAILAMAALLHAPGLRAQTAPHVTVAVYPGLGAKLWKEKVTDPFTAETGIPAEVFETPLPATAVAQAGGNPKFNVALVAGYQIPGLVKSGLIDLLTPTDIPNIKDVPEKVWLKTPDGQLTGMPVYFGLYGIAYNTSLAKASDFKSWDNLLDPQWHGQLLIARPSNVAAYDINLYAKLHGGDEAHLQPGYDFLKKLIPATLNSYTSMASLMTQIGRGEAVAAPFYANEITMLRRAGSTDVALRIPDEGGMILPYFLVIPKNAPDPASARRFLNTVIGTKYEAAFPVGSGAWPMNPKTEIPAATQKEMGATADDAIAHNFSPNWWTIGSNLEAETHKIDAMMQGGK